MGSRRRRDPALSVSSDSEFWRRRGDSVIRTLDPDSATSTPPCKLGVVLYTASVFRILPSLEKSFNQNLCFLLRFYGDGRIPTSDPLSDIPHFECGAFDHSATSPILKILPLFAIYSKNAIVFPSRSDIRSLTSEI